MMESEESQISVWVCREEKLVTGLSKRTTCADVVRVLMAEHNVKLSTAMLSGIANSYCIVEKWRGFERTLPNKTKILRLWKAWGDEQENVRFVLVKNAASLGSQKPRSAEARVVPSKENACILKGSARATMGFSPEIQRRIVRKAFRKLEKINKKRGHAASKDVSSAEKIETLVHLVISQDYTIRQQIQRIKELDAEIERYEAKVHFDRIKQHGVNYVQDTYLVDATANTADAPTTRDGDKWSSVDFLAKFEEYAWQCEEVVRLQDELSDHEALMDSITVEIQEELNQRWMKRRREELSKHNESMSDDRHSAADSLGLEVDNEWILEEERIKTELDTSLYIGLRLNTDLEAIMNDINLTQEIMGAKEKEIMDLLEKVNTLDIEEGTAREEVCKHVTTKTEMMCTIATKGEWVEQARGLSKKCSTNDDDSDTGLSSLHSLDSDNQTVCQSL